jgi:uncharacterized protein (DUF302 family)
MEYYSRKIKMSFQEVLEKVTQNLLAQGFGVVTSIDIQETFKDKLNIAFRNYKILGACNPRFAYNAISMESRLGMMLPCNIVIQEHENGEVEVSAINPLEGLDNFSNTAQLINLALEVGIRLRAAIDFIQRDLPKSIATHYPLIQDGLRERA